MDKAIWKPSGEWSCFVSNVLAEVKDVSTYQIKKKCIYLFCLVFLFFLYNYLVFYFFLYLVLFLDKRGVFFFNRKKNNVVGLCNLFLYIFFKKNL